MRLLSVLLLTLSLAAVADAAAPFVVRFDRHGDPLPPGALMRFGSSRLRHPFRLGKLAISPDGSKVASLGTDGRVWDSRTGRLLATFDPGEVHNWAVCFSPDGKSVLSANGTNLGDEVWIWDLATGKRRALWGDRQYRGIIERFAFSHDGKTLAVMSKYRDDGDHHRVCLHDYPSGKSRGLLKLDELAYIIEGMRFDPRGRLVLPSEGVHLFDVKRLREVGRVGGKVGIFSFALSPDGMTAAILIMEPADKDKDDRATVRLVRLDSGRTTTTPVKGPLRSRMTFSADGKELLFASRSGPIVAVDTKTGKQTRVISAGDGVWRPSQDFSADGRFLAWSDFQTIQVIDLPTGKPTATFDDHRDSTGVDAALSPDSQLAVTRSATEVRIWDRKSGKMLRRIAGEGFVPGAGWSPDGKFVTVGRPGKFCWYDASSGKLVREIKLPKADEPKQARLTDDGKRVVFADYDNERTLPTWVFNAADGKQLAVFRRSKSDEPINSPDGRFVLWRLHGGDDKNATFEVRSVDTGKRTWMGQVADVYPEGRLFESGQAVFCARQSIQAWDVNRGRVCGPTFVPDARRLYRNRPAAVSPDGRTVVLAQQLRADAFSFVARLTLVELASGQARATLPLLPACDSAAFSHDGKFLITSSDGSALVWDVDELGARTLTGREWDDLAGDGRAGFVAVGSLVAHPEEAVGMLSKKLTPSRIDAKQVRRWLDQLDSEEFETRAAAEKALAALGDHVEDELYREAANPTTEVRVRLLRLLRTVEEGTPDGLRRSRAIEVLERVGSAEAVRVLKRLAGGHAGARQTRQAAETLGRIKARS